MNEQTLEGLLKSCGQPRFPAHKYLLHLGLPLARADDGRSLQGCPRFEGTPETVKQLKALYKLSRDPLEDLVKSHGSTTETLHKATLTKPFALLDEVTSNLLAEHGPSIWGTSEPHKTRIDSAYPKDLFFANPQHKEIIQKLIYLWIVHRAFQKIARNGATTKPSNTTRDVNMGTDAWSLAKDDKRTESPYPLSDTEESYAGQTSKPEISRRSNNVRRGKFEEFSQTTQVNQASEVPVAQMMPQLWSALTQQTPPTNFNIGQSSSIHASIASRKSQTPDEAIAGSSCYYEDLIPDTTTRCRVSQSNEVFPKEARSNKRQEDFDIEQTVKKIKRSLHDSPQQGLNNQRMQLRPANVLTPTLKTRSDGQSSMLSSANLTDKNTDSVQDGPCTTSTDDINGDEDNRSTAANEDNRTRDFSQDQLVADGFATRASPGTRELVQETLPSAQETDLPHVSTIGSTAQDEQIEKEQLALDVVDLLDAPESGRHDLRALSSTVTYLQCIGEGDMLKLRQEFGNSFEKCQGALDQWLHLAKKFVEFRELTGFDGDRKEWDKFLESLEGDKMKQARRPFLDTKLFMTKLRKGSALDLTEMSKNVAKMLHALADWDTTMGLPELEDGCTRFNTTLLQWFCKSPST